LCRRAARADVLEWLVLVVLTESIDERAYVITART
jgi:hypothetical protein